LPNWYGIGITSVIEFAAVVIGVLVAFELDRRHENSIERSREKEFLIFIREEIKNNRETVTRLLLELKKTLYLPYYRLRSFALSSMSERITLIKNDKLRTDAITAYAKFDMFERTLDRYLDLIYTLIKEFGEVMPVSGLTAAISELKDEAKATKEITKELPKTDSERQEARWKGLLQRTREIQNALIGQIEQSKDGINDYCQALDIEIDYEIKRLKPRKRPWKAVLLTLTLISGLVSLTAGIVTQIEISSGPHYSMSAFGTGAVVGWYPLNASVNPRIEIAVMPFINDTNASVLIITTGGSAPINGSFPFRLHLPFHYKQSKSPRQLVLPQRHEFWFHYLLHAKNGQHSCWHRWASSLQLQRLARKRRSRLIPSLHTTQRRYPTTVMAAVIQQVLLPVYAKLFTVQ
jgi:hypothetical protein